MKRLVDTDAVTDVDPGRGADAADNSSPQVADQIAVEITHDEDIKLLRFQNHLHTAIIDNDLPGLQV